MVVSDECWRGDSDVTSLLVDGRPRLMDSGLFVEQVPAGEDGDVTPVGGRLTETGV